jgi:hypothetical protein
MVTVTPVLDRLYSIENLVTPQQLADIHSIDWLQMPTQPNTGQEHLTQRKRIDCLHPDILRINQYIQNAFAEINRALDTDFNTPPESAWWIDHPGFEISIHTDDPVRVTNSLQMYWVMPSEDYGTVFYKDLLPADHPDQRDRMPDQVQVLHQFPSRANTGYLILNPADPLGKKPSLWHGMLNQVPVGHYRVSSYATVMPV